MSLEAKQFYEKEILKTKDQILALQSYLKRLIKEQKRLFGSQQK